MLIFVLALTALPMLSLAAPDRNVTVACYYFPNYHPGDPRNDTQKGKGWCEWELVKEARPRFPGHVQPNIPLWGYADESDFVVMERKIDAAADHGVDAFIFDWYWYDDGPFLERAIERGFMRAGNNRRLAWALMWADHDWIDIHPHTLARQPAVLYPGRVKPATFERMTAHIVARYFTHPSYWKIEERPYFSVYDLTTLLASFGSVEATRAALDAFRAKTKAAGFPDAHLNAVVWGRAILPGETTPTDAAELVKRLGFDSVTSYVWVHHVALSNFPQTDYVYVRGRYLEYWRDAEKRFAVPYYPNVTMGWDSSPRAAQSEEYVNAGYPFMAVMSGNTPERFEEALKLTRERLMKRPRKDRIVTINCWNEWTEGSYLEPDVRNGSRYLEAVEAVFGGRPEPLPNPVEDPPGVPRVLLIGDSISMGYTPFVRSMLEGVAAIHRPPMNCQSTKHGLLYLDEWLGKGSWDVIHFNFGLHDLKHIDELGRRVDEGGKKQIPLERYEKNLEELVARLQKTGAALIWCATTPVPEGAFGRIAGDESSYNRAAERVMKARGVAINDLCAFARASLGEIQRPRDVHFTAEGSRALAREVADAIRAALKR